MTNEHIGRIKQFGLGKQSVAGTPVAPTIWIPTLSPVEFKHNFEKIKDESVYGTIDMYGGDEHISKKSGEITGELLARDENIGHFFKASLGTETLVDIIKITGHSGGTPARNDVISSVTGSWAGVIEKIILVGATTLYAVSTTSGTIGDLDAKTDLTNGTWTGGTVEQSDYSSVKGHFFERLNANTGYPLYSLYTEDPVAGREMSDAQIDTFDLEVMPDTYPKLSFGFKGINLTDGGVLTPANTSENQWLAGHIAVYFATNEAGLNAASAECLRRFKFSLARNLEEDMCVGTDGAISGYLGGALSLSGDLEAKFNSETYRNYHLNNSYRSMRIAMINNSVTALADVTGDDDVYPSIYIDQPKAFFKEWGSGNDNNTIRTQTLGYDTHNDRENTATSVEVLLLNDRATVY